MSRLLTMSELYALLQQFPDAHMAANTATGEKTATPIQLRAQSPVFWMAPRGASIALARPASQPKSSQHVQIAGHLLDMMHHVAQASGLNDNEAWNDAAQAWIAQRQHDVQELASPTGRELARAVQRVWSVIDEQMHELRKEKSR